MTNDAYTIEKSAKTIATLLEIRDVILQKILLETQQLKSNINSGIFSVESQRKIVNEMENCLKNVSKGVAKIKNEACD